MTCKTCKWWEEPTDYVRTVTTAGYCRSPKLVDINDRGYEGVAGTGFGMDYPVCHLVTGPDFGCIHHEPKE